MTRLREEVLRVVGSERCPSYEDLKDMKYLRAFLNGKPGPVCSVLIF